MWLLELTWKTRLKRLSFVLEGDAVGMWAKWGDRLECRVKWPTVPQEKNFYSRETDQSQGDRHVCLLKSKSQVSLEDPQGIAMASLVFSELPSSCRSVKHHGHVTVWNFLEGACTVCKQPDPERSWIPDVEWIGRINLISNCARVVFLAGAFVLGVIFWELLHPWNILVIYSRAISVYIFLFNTWLFLWVPSLCGVIRVTLNLFYN